MPFPKGILSKDLIEIYRAVLVHMIDKDSALRDENSKIYGLLHPEPKKFYQQIKKAMELTSCHFPVKLSVDNNLNDSYKVLISFIGSGNYECVNYKFNDNGKELNDSSFIGNSMCDNLFIRKK